MSDDQLREIYTSYAKFGQGQNTTNTIDNVRFYKICNDAGLIEGSIARADVDLAFTKVMKRQRKMTFEQFQEALGLLAKKSKKDLAELVDKVNATGGPKKNNVTEFSNEAWVHKQTAPELYTGMHKFRFDQEGKGRGIEGRRSFEDIKGGLSHILDRSRADIRGRKTGDVALVERENEERARIAAEQAERERRIREKDPMS